MPTPSRRAALVGAAQAVALLAAACSVPRAGPLRAPTELSPTDGAPTKSLARAEPVAPRPSPTPAPTYTPATTPLVAVKQGPECAGALREVVRPTPIPYPGYTQQEPSTTLHVTADPQVVELATYRLAVNGRVARELSLTYDELRCLPKVSAEAVIECPGYFVDRSKLAGASLASVLALAGPREGTDRVQFIAVDFWSNGCPLVEAQAAENFLAYEWEGEPLPVSHGFPVRVAMPGKSGGLWVKWVTEIKIL